MEEFTGAVCYEQKPPECWMQNMGKFSHVIEKLLEKPPALPGQAVSS